MVAAACGIGRNCEMGNEAEAAGERRESGLKRNVTWDAIIIAVGLRMDGHDPDNVPGI